MRDRVFTQGEIEWLTENYPIKSNYFCRTYLHISNTRLLNKAKELGLEKVKGKHSEVRKPKPKKSPYYKDTDAPGGYCMDCRRYCKLTCKKTGREVGALWQKKCFKGRG